SFKLLRPASMGRGAAVPASVRPAEVSENFVPPTSAPTTSREVAWLMSPEVLSALVAVAATRPRVTGPAARTLARKAASETTPSAVRFTEAVEPTRLARVGEGGDAPKGAHGVRHGLGGRAARVDDVVRCGCAGDDEVEPGPVGRRDSAVGEERGRRLIGGFAVGEGTAGKRLCRQD